MFQFLPTFSLIITACLAYPNYSTVRKIDGRIVGGNETNIEKYPWQVSIQRNGRQKCGGSIIKEDVIITAAHCIGKKMKEDHEIVAGTTNLKEGGARYGIEKTIVHNNYKNLDFDIALIILKEKITYNEQIKLVFLPKLDEEVQVGSPVQVTGWGLLHPTDKTTPAILREVLINIVDHAACQKAYDKESITENMICASVPEGGKDSCQGDSGGPLTQNGVLFGIVSWGYGCGNPDYPGVYTNVAHLRDWIMKNAEV